MIRITDRIAIDEEEIKESFLRAGGPGGQNVNKVASAVQLRFDASKSPSLDEVTRARLRRIAGRLMTAEDVIVITARRFRTQHPNRADTYERLLDLLRGAVQPGKPRVSTRPTLAPGSATAKQKQRRTVSSACTNPSIVGRDAPRQNSEVGKARSGIDNDCPDDCHHGGPSGRMMVIALG
jgi:ribosome-associated protein